MSDSSIPPSAGLRVAEILLTDGRVLRATILHAHQRAWDDSTAERMVQRLSDRDLFCLMVATSRLVCGVSELDAWLQDVCTREQDVRDLSLEDELDARRAA